VTWTSGLLYSPAQYEEGKRAEKQQQTAEQRRIQALKDNPDLPMVYFDVAIKGVPAGRITYVLFSHIAPRAAENFRALFSGEKGTVPDDGTGREGAGLPYSFKVIRHSHQ
jgi:peptidyl-prolyl isomerase D